MSPARFSKNVHVNRAVLCRLDQECSIRIVQEFVVKGMSITRNRRKTRRARNGAPLDETGSTREVESTIACNGVELIGDIGCEEVGA